jgi:hypothetical protein
MDESGRLLGLANDFAFVGALGNQNEADRPAKWFNP